MSDPRQALALHTFRNVGHGDVLHVDARWRLVTRWTNRVLVVPIIEATTPPLCGDVPLLHGDVPGMTVRDGLVVRTRSVATAPLSGFVAWRASADLMRRVRIGLEREIDLERNLKVEPTRSYTERCVRF